MKNTRTAHKYYINTWVRDCDLNVHYQIRTWKNKTLYAELKVSQRKTSKIDNGHRNRNCGSNFNLFLYAA